ncbi:hypothetical protein ACFX13_025328 [Malus domestica]|uniref:Uncharacterized protein n=2 Tax=Malus TaxID=3749 RepID=A0A498H915_MALDO|nr:uncharacterized protein LOC103405381 [Malus domestica]XP_008342591.1 uncharacterized protein LOC103405381 [Malus domestica]XP_050135122.1 uncharacterized protein LOC126610983 [Malus sylvestris]XP_050135123.1 uncharacterized protein LOC126610983 [Malus sylvestris]TQD99099.1 hypothetical protein C1H46_015300 [Malus baccata]RXH67479.1 hypothetical protein DVH24_027626 [Malus domestica]
MARSSISQTLTLTRHLSPKSSPSSSRLITLRAQSTLPFHHDPPTDSSADSPSDPLLRKLEDAIHRIIVRRSAPDWLPFLPGASYWVPPPRSRSHGLAQLVDKLANPLSEEETMSMSTVRGWPSSAYFIEGTSPQLMEPVVVFQSSDDVSNPQPMETADQISNNVSKSEDEEG